MKETKEDNLFTDIAKDLIGYPDKLSPLAGAVIDNYNKRYLIKYRLIVESGDRTQETIDNLLKEYKEGGEELFNELINTQEYKTELYLRYYNKIKEVVDKGEKCWGEILSTYIYEDEYSMNEIFVRLVEEQEGVKITSVKQLQELTGITEIGDNKKTAKQRAFEEMEDTFIKAMSYRYSFTLEGILKAGGVYSDLLVVEPKDFNLPETWSKGIAKDKNTMILYAISSEFSLFEAGGLILYPDLRSIAKEIEAPYSIILEAKNTNLF